MCVTALKDVVHDDAALFLGPGLPIGVKSTWIFDLTSIRAAGGLLPAVSKIQCIGYHTLVSQGKVIVRVAIIISAETTHLTLSWEINIVDFILHWVLLFINLFECKPTLKLGLSLMNRLVFWSHTRRSPLLASMTM